jgi:hypothetical protein
MRKVIVALAVAVSAIGLAGTAQAKSWPCTTSTPAVNGVQLGVGVTSTIPGYRDIYVCATPGPSESGYVHFNAMAKPDSRYGYTLVDAGGGAGTCQYLASPGGEQYVCLSAGGAGGLVIWPNGDGGSFFGGVGACEARETDIWGNCVMTFNGFTLDGVSGKTMGVGTVTAVCTQAPGMFCVPNALGLPSGTYTDLTSERDLVLWVLVTVLPPSA